MKEKQNPKLATYIHSLIECATDNTTNKTKTPKIAVYVMNGMVVGVRSNISTKLDIELVDSDVDKTKANIRWQELQTELEFGNY